MTIELFEQSEMNEIDISIDEWTEARCRNDRQMRKRKTAMIPSHLALFSLLLSSKYRPKAQQLLRLTSLIVSQ